MPLDDYASLGGGALRLKGGKVTKKKKRKEKGGLEKALSGGETAVVKAGDEGEEREKRKKDRKRRDEGEGEGEGEEEKEEERPVVRKTEAERRIDELKRKRFLEMAENPEARPELLKTHKERVEELNSFLSKLSEHNDMPKIGPG